MNALNFQWTDGDLKALRDSVAHFKSFQSKPINQDNFFEAYKICYSLFDKVPLATIRVDVPYVLRGRPNFNGQMFSDEWEISYHQKDAHLIKAGRFNRPQEPMFYCAVANEIHPSHFMGAACMEASKGFFLDGNIEPTQYITFGKWYLKYHFDVVNLCYDTKLLSVNPILNTSTQNHVQTIFRTFPPKTADFIIEFWAFLSQLAGNKFDNENDHFLTTIFWRALIRYRETVLKLPTTGILYPSTLSNNEGLNLVLQPDAVDALLQLKTVFMIKMSRHSNSSKDIDVEQCSKEVEVKDGRFSFSTDL